MRLTYVVPLTLLLVWLQNPAPGRRKVSGPEQKQSAEGQQPTAQNQRGTETKPLFVKVLPPQQTLEESVRNATESREKATNDRNLVIVTAILAAIGFLQLLVFGYQATQLRKTVEAAAGQSEDMKRTVTEASRSAAAMEKVAEHIEISAAAATASVSSINQQMRAYLCAVIGGATYQERPKNLRFQASPQIINAGLTPAYRVFFRINAAILPVPLPKDFAFPLPAERNGGPLVGPRQSMAVSPVVRDFCGDSEVDKIKRGEGQALYAWGIIEYEDVFRNQQYTKFCQIYTWLPDGKIWGYYTENHNEAT